MADPGGVGQIIIGLRGDFPYDSRLPDIAADLLESQAARIAELEAALETERVKTRHFRRDGNYETCPQCHLVKPWHEEYCPARRALASPREPK